jgi:hypothetical protein
VLAVLRLRVLGLAVLSRRVPGLVPVLLIGWAYGAGGWFAGSAGLSMLSKGSSRSSPPVRPA